MGLLSKLFGGGGPRRTEVVTMGSLDEGVVAGLAGMAGVDAEVVRPVLERLLDQARFTTEGSARARSGAGFVARCVRLPAVPEAELRESVAWEAEQYIPFDMDEVALEHAVLGRDGDDMEVLLLAVKTH